MRIRPHLLLLAAFITLAQAAEKLSVPQLIELSRKPGSSQEFADALRATLGDADIKKGSAVLGEGPDFLWAIESDKQSTLYVDDQRTAMPARIGSSNLWFYAGKLRPGTSHNFHYLIDGTRFGGRTDIAAYAPDSYSRSGVPQGKLSDKIIHTSKIYDGMQTEYWIYVPAQYDPSVAAALMVWQDGQGLITRDGPSRLMNVVDNLIHQKKIPVMIQVLIAPGKIGDKAMRSIEYDTVSDRYARFLRDEILADVQAKYNIRRDGYSRAIAGNSSGGICSFNVAWHQPDQFSRVLSRIGSFTSIQWKTGQPDALDGGNDYPFKIRKEPKRNVRVWLQDGSEDLENPHGSWPLQNIQMANSLKMREYDFHLSFGNGTHNGAHGNAELPEELIWLWRDYDPAKTEQQFAMDPAEKEKPYYRVKIYNRE
ncbi:MAG TPA: alpha/beta hydrolase-fold protein [Acidobacteriota bacterium]|jgi:enterochelin esterase family protein